MKDLHVKLQEDTHRLFMTKAASDNTKVSTLLRKWIGRYLKGDLT